MTRKNHETGRTDRRNLTRRRTTATPFDRAEMEGRIRAAVRSAISQGLTPFTTTRNGVREDSDLALDRTRGVDE